MLLIAQPKSASTSLLKTLAKIAKIKYQNGFSKEIGWEYCEGFSEIQKYHDTTIKRNYSFLRNWMVSRGNILKDHILPTEHHKNIITKINTKIVILLRNPEHTFDNYKRLYNSYKNGELTDECVDELMPYRLEKLNWDLFLQDLILFNKLWREFNYEKKLIITFDDLILKYEKTIKDILNFWGLQKPEKIVPLLRSKGNHGYNTYTGVGEKRLRENDQ